MLSPVRALGGCAWAAAVVRLLRERGELKLLLYQAVHRTILQAAASDHLWPVRRRLIAGPVLWLLINCLCVERVQKEDRDLPH